LNLKQVNTGILVELKFDFSNDLKVPLALSAKIYFFKIFIATKNLKNHSKRKNKKKKIRDNAR